MTKSKNTKRALLASILSMMLCMAMLVGSTFAWFTDSVTSGKNKIVAGSLDIELNYKNAKMAASGENFAEVLPTTENLFVSSEGGAIRWEPGVTAVTYLELKNVGNLALKYSLSVSAEDTVVGNDGAALSKVLKTAVVEIEASKVGSYNRDAAIAAAEAADAQGVLTYAKTGTMTAQNETLYLAMIVYFPKEIGNTVTVDGTTMTYNRSDVELETDLSLKLLATQFEYENDSFDKDYDKDLPLTWAATPEELNSAIADGGSVMVMSNIDAGKALGFEIKDNTVINGNGNVLTTSSPGDSSTQSRVLDMFQLTNKTLTVSDAVIGGNDGTSYPDRGISLSYNTNPVLNIKNSTVQAKTLAVCIAPENTNPEVNISHSTVKAESYAVNINPSIKNPKVNFEGSTIEGYAAFQTHSGGVTGTFKNSTFKGVNKWSAEGDNNFAVIVVSQYATEAGTNLTFDNCTISAEEQSTATEYFFSLRESCTLNLNGCTFVKNGETVSTDDIITDIQTGVGKYVQIYTEIDVTIFVDGVQIKPAA